MLAEGARLAAADGIGLRVFGPARRARARRRRGDRGRPDRGVDRQRGGPGAARCGRRRRPRSCAPPRDVAEGALGGDGQPRLDRGDDGGRDLRPAPAEGRAAAGPRRAAAGPRQAGPLPRRRRQRRGPRPAPGPVRLPRRRLQRRRARGRAARGSGCSRSARSPARAARRSSRRTRLLAAADGIDFAGNVEGRDLPAGAADVVVTDGFTGNVALKLMEGTAKTRRRRDPRRRPLQPARRRSAAC